MTTSSTSWVGRLSDVMSSEVPRRDQLRIWVLALVVAGVALRSWLISRAWFLSDDFILLEDAQGTRLDLNYLFTPHDSHLMPLGRFVVWLTAQAAPFSWWPAALTTILLLAVAALCCTWMLVEAFGWRWRILVPLAFYLFTPLTIDSVIWWAAAINALPVHIGFFLAMTLGLRYARTASRRALLLCLLAFGIGLAGDPRGLHVAPTLALTVALFMAPRGSTLWQRVTFRWRLWVGLAATGVLYLLLYQATTPSPVTAGAEITPWATLRNALGRSWVSGLVGGPWNYDESNPPAGFVDPPIVLNVVAGAAVAALVIAALRLIPATTTKVALIMSVHLAVTMVGLVFGRATQIGPDAGLLMRFFGDTALTATVVLALLLMRPLGGWSRELPLPSGHGRDALAGAGALASAGAVVTMLAYGQPWTSYPARTFVTNAAESAEQAPVVVADVAVPPLVQTRIAFPHNLPSRLLLPLAPKVRGVTHGNDLQILDSEGVPRQGVVAPAARSVPGPAPDCGYAVGPEPVTIDLEDPNGAVFWWMAVDYIAGQGGMVEMSVDGRPLPDFEVTPGLHRWIVEGNEPFGSVEMRSISGITVCVDSISVDSKIRADQ